MDGLARGAIFPAMPDRKPATPEPPDANTELVRAVEKLTDSEPVCGEDLLGSEDLKRQLREAKEREAKRTK